MAPWGLGQAGFRSMVQVFVRGVDSLPTEVSRPLGHAVVTLLLQGELPGKEVTTEKIPNKCL